MGVGYAGFEKHPNHRRVAQMLQKRESGDFRTFFIRLTGLLFLLLLSSPAPAQIIQLQVSENLIATADLMQGSKEGKSVLILHGFLQTRDFFTVRRLAESLHDEGHTILLPTLSLGIDQRKQSLACEAIHTHSLEQDIDELAQWVDWFSEHQGSNITLVGHSIGSLLLLAYLDKYSSAPIESTLFISLIAFAQGPIAKESEEDRLKAIEKLEAGDNAITEHPLAFCDNYVTTPKNYLSYVNWNSQRSIDTLTKIDKQPVVILGDADRRLGKDWLPLLNRAGVETVQIPDADHFFNHGHEFVLADAISEQLE
jgi:pimeloyl-ACP methyl ester carboxylesterase